MVKHHGKNKDQNPEYTSGFFLIFTVITSKFI